MTAQPYNQWSDHFRFITGGQFIGVELTVMQFWLSVVASTIAVPDVETSLDASTLLCTFTTGDCE